MKPYEPIDIRTDEFGDCYDELPLWSAPFGQMLLDRVPLRRGMTVVDVGAGTGFLALELARRCGPESTVYAVDPWGAALDRLSRKAALAGDRNVRVLAQDAAALDLPADSVDLVVSNLGVNNFDNADAVLAACFRVLKPGAPLVLTTNLVGHMREFYEEYREVLLARGHAERIPTLEAHVAHRATVESVQARLARAGFANGPVTTGSFRMRFADGRALLEHWFVRFGFLPAWREIAPPADVEGTLAALEARLDAIARERGELALTIPTACLEGRKPAG